MNEIFENANFKEVRDIVSSFWNGIMDDKEIDMITNFLIHQGVDEVNGFVINKIKNCHTESDIPSMFNWIYSGYKSPYEIKNSPNVEEMGNVLILPEGDCIYWYEIGVDKEPYIPYDTEEMER